MIQREYINSDGFVTIQPNAIAVPGEGNGWLQTGLAHACGMYPNPAELPKMLVGCMGNPRALSPLIWRSPWKVNPGDETKCDDYWGALICSQQWAEDVLDWAEATGWDFDIGGHRRAEYRFDRFHHFPPFLRATAGKKLTVWDALHLAFEITRDAFTLERADGMMRTYCVIVGTEKTSTLCRIAGDIWRRNARKKFGWIGAAWVGYFPKDHPLVMFDSPATKINWHSGARVGVDFGADGSIGCVVFKGV